MEKKVLVAMSGGVDSSVAAYLIREAGYAATGVTMRLYDNELLGESSGKPCGNEDSIADARSVADALGIPYEVCDFRAEFRREVVDRFIADYESGRTPNPCIVCNRHLKFDYLCRCGRSMGQDCVATGHYVRIEKDGSGRFLLRKAVDLSKDQSYVLYTLSQEQLSRTLFPLGSLHKSETREIAQQQGFLNAQRSESQDICFVPDGDYIGFIRRYTGNAYPEGDFVDREGHVLGRHKGIIRYTIGQRKGLGLALKTPMYVCAIDAAKNRVILGTNDDLFTRELEAEHVNWIAIDAPKAPFRANARIRYKHQESPAEIIPLSDSRIKILFDTPQRAITRGQSVVLYDGDYVIGGGTIL